MAVNYSYGLRLHFILNVTVFVLLLSRRACSVATTPRHKERPGVQDVDFYEPSSEQLTQFRQLILDALGLKTVPDVSKMNVSSEEFERMHRVYEQRLEQNRRSRNTDEDVEVDEQKISLHSYSIISSRSEGSSRSAAGGGKRDRHSDTRWSLRYQSPSFFPVAKSAVSQLRLRWLRQGHAGRHQASLLRDDVILSLRWSGQEANTVIDARQLVAQWRHNASAEMVIHLGDALSRLPSNTSDLEVKVTCQGHFCQVLSDAQLSVADVEVWQPASSENRSRLKRAHRLEDIFKPKRGRTDCDKRDKKKRCCRQSLKINFRNLEGFEWIVSPKVAELYMCKGKCQYLYNPAHNHALFQGFLHTKKLAPKLCCTPSKLDGLEILHLRDDDPSKLAVARWENAIVTECACA